jgi:predicted methyltransferase
LTSSRLELAQYVFRFLKATESMGRGIAAVFAVVLSGACAGCESWTGFGFRAGSREMAQLRQVLTLEPGKVVADVGAGKGELTFALAKEVGPKGHVFSRRTSLVK